jgi:hypothetical protein
MSSGLDLSNIDTLVADFFSDNYVTSSLVVFIILYISLVANKLPKTCSLLTLLDSNLFQMTLLLLIGYVSTKNYTIAIMLTIAFFATLFTMQKHQVNDKLVSIIIVDSVNSGKEEVVTRPVETQKRQVRFNIPEIKEKIAEIPKAVPAPPPTVQSHDEPRSAIMMQEIDRAGISSRDQTGHGKREQSMRPPMQTMDQEMSAGEEHFEISGFGGGDFATY